MTRQFMVRILRDHDDLDWADVVVDSIDEETAKQEAVDIVKRDPHMWFDVPPPPTYSVDPSYDVEELDGSEYASANEVRP